MVENFSLSIAFMLHEFHLTLLCCIYSVYARHKHPNFIISSLDIKEVANVWQK